MGTTAWNEGRLLLLGDWGPAAIVLFCLAAVVILGLTWMDLAGLLTRRRVTLTALRAVTLLLAMTLLLEPSVELRNVTPIPNHVVVLVDDSRSQELPGPGERPRWQATREALERLRPFVENPPDVHVAEVWRYADAATPTNLSSLLDERRVPDGATTRTLEALRQVHERHDASALGGVILISDGIDHGELGARTPRGQPLDAESARLLQRLGAPVHVINTGGDRPIRDIAVQRIIHDDFAFVRNAVTVSADIRVEGFPSGVVPVTLRREGQLLQSRQITLREDQDVYRVDFEFVPELLGKEIYSVHVPVLEGDALPANNRDHFVLKVIRDRIRILQVTGRPTWDVRFLRQLLKSNPNVDLISFFILRSHDDIVRAPQDEMALIPFPTDELFQQQLGSFDLVILQNFTYAPYRMRQYLRNIRDYVMGGGGLLMVGGEQSFSAGGYAGTELTEILPVQLPAAAGNSAATIDSRAFRPQLTPAGERHPITRLEFDRMANLELWDQLPEQVGTNIVLGPRPGATVLATHPDLRAGDGGMPVLAIMEPGEGRTMAMTFDGAWRWNYEWVLSGGSSRPYTSFWNSLIRWLIRDPALNLVQVDIATEVVQPGDDVDVQIRVFLPDYSPAAALSGTLRVEHRELEELAPNSPGTLIEERAFTTDARGRARVTLPAVRHGAWRAIASVEVEPGSVLDDDEIFLAIDRSPELRDLQPRPDLLEAIAAETGGSYQTTAPAAARLRFAPPRLARVNDRRVIALWTTPWVLLVLIALLGSEWHLRRRWGRR